MTDASSDWNALLAEEPFVRALARAVVRDAARADDIVQQAYLRALRQPPSNPRGWFRVVVRRLARRHSDEEAARRRREIESEARGFAPSPADVLEREATRRELVEALLQLPPDTRDVLLLRFYEGLSPRTIAGRLGRSSGTVRSRLSRGLEQLREILDRRRGSRRAWCLGLIPWTRGPGLGAGIWLSLGAWTMSKKITLAVAAILAIAFTTRSFSGRPSRPSPPTEPTPQSVPAESASDAPSPAATPPAERDAIDVAAARSPVVRLRHADGSPAADVAYWFSNDPLPPAGSHWTSALEDPAETASTGAEGQLRVERNAQWLWCRATKTDRVAYRIDGIDDEVLLPETAALTLTCLGIPPNDEYRVTLRPQFTTAAGDASGTWVVHRDAGPAAIVSTLGFAFPRGSEPHSVELLTHLRWSADAAASGHAIERTSAERIVRPPASMAFVVSRPLPEVPFEVLEADGTPSAMRGLLTVRTSPTSTIPMWLPASHRKFGYVDLERGESYPFVLLMDDGELFRGEFTIAEPQPAVRLRRGEGTAPRRLRIDRGPAVTTADRIWLDTGGQLRGLQLAPPVFFSERRPFGGGDLATGELYIHAEPWQRLWLVTADGHIASDTTDPGRLTWLESFELGAMDLRSAYVDRTGGDAGDEAWFRFEIELQLTTGATHWQIVDRFLHRPSDPLFDARRIGWPVWTKRALRAGSARIRIRVANGPWETLR